MNISAMRVRITIQKNSTVVDAIGNHRSAWEDHFTCWATASTSGRSADETEGAAHTIESARLDFTVRWCSETAVVDSKQYRIILDDRIYNIVAVDDMGFKHNSRKFSAVLSER